MDNLDVAILKVFELQNGRRFNGDGTEITGDALLDASLDSIDIPSLLLLELIMMLEDEADVEIEDIDGSDVNSLRDIKDYVKKK